MKLKLGVENFRVFKEMTDFEIRPLTLLIGPNNSGKSSFTKLLLLLKNGIKKLKFDVGSHNLESFKDCLSWGSKNKTLNLKVPNGIEWLSDDFYVELTYATEQANIREIVIRSNNEILLEIKEPKKISDGTAVSLKSLPSALKDPDFKFTEYEDESMYINIDLLIQILYNKDLYYYSFVNNYYEKQSIRNLLGNLNKKNAALKDLTLKNVMNKFDENEKLNFFKEFGLYHAFAFCNEMETANENGLLYDVFVNNKNISSAFEEDIRVIQTDFCNNYNLRKHSKNFSEPVEMMSVLSLLKEGISFINTGMKDEIKKHFIEELNLTEKDSVEVKETILGEIIFYIEVYNDSMFLSEMKYSFIENLSIPFYDNQFGGVDYIGANRGTKNKILLDKENENISKVYSKYFDFEEWKKEWFKKYFREVLQIFGVPGELVVERFQDSVTALFVQLDDKGKGENGKVNLNNLGFGFSQLIPIILKTLTLKDERPFFVPTEQILSTRPAETDETVATLIIEEPEANLHPLLQSKLADFFALTVKFFPNVNLVVETHSEYLIRRLQILTAQNEINREQIMIHYFNSDENVSVNEPKVKKIEIANDGQLTDIFGPGFFDEATNLKYELMKYNNKSRMN